MIRQFIRHVVNGENLGLSEMTEAMELVFDEQTRPSQIAALLIALRQKGETVDEITAAAQVIRRHTPRLKAMEGVVVLDRDEINMDEETVTKTCSLNGAETRTFNISTATALVVAGAGVRVAKYGSRVESTFCGSANVVSELGINLDLTLTEVERCIEEVGLGFLYAHLFHTPMAVSTQVREEIGVRTIFNLVGPLANPAGGEAQVLGVYLPERTELMSRVLQQLGCRQAMVVCGQDTLDELTITGPTKVSHLAGGAVSTYELVPEDLGMSRAAASDISGGGARDNARIIRGILEGAPGPRRDVVLLNSAAALVVAGRASDLKDGLTLARESIDSGSGRTKLDDLIRFTAQCGVYQHKDFS